MTSVPRSKHQEGEPHYEGSLGGRVRRFVDLMSGSWHLRPPSPRLNVSDCSWAQSGFVVLGDVPGLDYEPLVALDRTRLPRHDAERLSWRPIGDQGQ